MSDDLSKKEDRLSVPERGSPERDEWERMVRDAYCKGASPVEFALFLQQCQTLDLTPVAGQICQIPFWDKEQRKFARTTIVKIDGFRAVAQRSGQYRGRLGPFWCGTDGEWRDVWLGTQNPAAAKVGILREGFLEPVWAVAKWESYCRKKDGQPIGPWRAMPEVMLAKCAEAQALRAAFSLLGGVYEQAELDHAIGNSKHRVNTDPQSHPPLITEGAKWTGTREQNQALAEKLAEAGIELVPENRTLFQELKEKLKGTPLSEVETVCSAAIEDILSR